MEIKETIGIDVGIATLDVCVHSTGTQNKSNNDSKGFRGLVDWALKESPFPKENGPVRF